MSRQLTYTDEELRLAVESACSWRDTLRRLGLKATSASAIRSVRSRADALGVSHDHFTGQRRWTETQLRTAVRTSETWDGVASMLNIHGNTARIVVKGQARRLGLDLTHLLPRKPPDSRSAVLLEPSVDELRRAGPMLAAAWFTMCGCDVSWPLEPCVYDLLASWDGETHRVQVKTTTQRQGRPGRSAWHAVHDMHRPMTPTTSTGSSSSTAPCTIT